MAGFSGTDGVSRHGRGEAVVSLARVPEILHLRTNNVISDLILVDSVGPDFTSAEWAQQIRAVIVAGSDAER